MARNRIIQGDCIKELGKLKAGTVDLAFADPPYNIGYEYDAYHDKKPPDEYVRWSTRWMAELTRVLKPTGTFWLAIGDEYAAELKVVATRELGLVCRSWVIWYYTFGVHCTNKFSRSHAHLLYFVRDPQRFTFSGAAIRVPSARQLVYADKRANPRGRVPDDTWIIRPTPHDSWLLRPQDLPEGFTAHGDTWYFPRICGTFKERAGFHGCQMPEQLLGRIIRACSNERDLVLDPFTGSGTTLAVAKKLNRQYLGIELSTSYVSESRRRLAESRVGDPLDGADNPLTSVASTLDGRSLPAPRRQAVVVSPRARRASEGTPRAASGPARSPRGNGRMVKGLSDLKRAIVEAFQEACEGYSSDRVLADPALDAEFVQKCRDRSIPGTPVDWNRALLALRKTNRLSSPSRTKRTRLANERILECEFASEIALGQLSQECHLSLDSLLCDPELASRFDRLAARIAPGFESLYYRWAALGLRKRAKLSRTHASKVAGCLRNRKFSRYSATTNLVDERVPERPGLYLLTLGTKPLYVGEAGDLRCWVKARDAEGTFAVMTELVNAEISFAHLALELPNLFDRRGAQSYEIARRRPLWNYPDLAAAAA